MRWRRKTERHPLFGNIPLKKDSTGFYRYDPEYRPSLPSGAIRGDVSKQVFCYAHYVPKYFYVDEPRTCIQCGSEFVFGAAEQKFWYERLKFNFNSVAIRCGRCRKRSRSRNSLRAELQAVVEGLRECPKDPHRLLALAKATVECRAVLGEGNLDHAISACRQVSVECPEAPVRLYWEARCQLLADRQEKAGSLFRLFLDESEGQNAKLVHDAKQRLNAGGGLTKP